MQNSMIELKKRIDFLKFLIRILSRTREKYGELFNDEQFRNELDKCTSNLHDAELELKKLRKKIINERKLEKRIDKEITEFEKLPNERLEVKII